jgi:hypothetical protein
LIRVCGTAGIVAAFLWVFSALVHPLDQRLTDLTSSRWIPAHIGIMLALAATALLLVGWQVRQGERTGSLGMAGFVLAICGVVLTAGSIAVESFGARFLVTYAPHLVMGGTHAPFFSSGIVETYTLLSGLVALAGLVLLTVATWRSDVLPRWAAVSVPVGTAVAAGVPTGVVSHIGFFILAAGLAWLGSALRRTERPAAIESVSA